MKASPLIVQWHEDNQPIYAAHFDPHGRGRLATAAADNSVRIWKVESVNEEQKVTYLATLNKHQQTVNVVRWSPRGDILASAGDDGNVILWTQAESNSTSTTAFGEDKADDLESWRIKKMCGATMAEIYDLAWSPDGSFFITGSMDNIARIYSASTGTCIRQIAEHSHYVQGVAWDPLNEFIATQSSDRSVHIYTLKTKSGDFSLDPHHKISKMDIPARRRISSSSPAPPDLLPRTFSFAEPSSLTSASPVPSAPGTPQSLALPMPMPMNPPMTSHTSHSRRSSFGSSPSIRRSASPAASLPLPAVMPNSPRPGFGIGGNHSSIGLGVKQANIYASEALPSFFRRLTFSPDGSLLFTPAGQYRMPQATSEDVVNTVYIYTRAGLNKPPVAFLPGHRKPSIAVRCSPIIYQLRPSTVATKNITLDTASAGEEIPALPESAMGHRMSISSSSMEPPPFSSAMSPSPSMTAPSPKSVDKAFESESSTPTLPPGPSQAFGLPYRIVYAVATQDAVYIYDTQQTKPLCVVSNLHYATFTDLTWSNDGLTLLMTSSDGFCSCVTFIPGELGQIYEGKVPATPTGRMSALNTSISSQPTPNITPITPIAPSIPRQQSITSAFSGARPASPARSMSAASSVGPFAVPGSAASETRQSTSMIPGSGSASGAVTPVHQQSQSQSQSQSQPQVQSQNSAILINPTPSLQNMPSVTAAQSGPVPSNVPTWMTPPETPIPAAPPSVGRTHSASSSLSGFQKDLLDIRPSTEIELPSISEDMLNKSKRSGEESEQKNERPGKKRRIEPTLVSAPEKN